LLISAATVFPGASVCQLVASKRQISEKCARQSCCSFVVRRFPVSPTETKPLLAAPPFHWGWTGGMGLFLGCAHSGAILPEAEEGGKPEVLPLF
jgi:hypothetical protein